MAKCRSAFNTGEVVVSRIQLLKMDFFFFLNMDQWVWFLTAFRVCVSVSARLSLGFVLYLLPQPVSVRAEGPPCPFRCKLSDAQPVLCTATSCSGQLTSAWFVLESCHINKPFSSGHLHPTSRKVEELRRQLMGFLEINPRQLDGVVLGRVGRRVAFACAVHAGSSCSAAQRREKF